MEKLMGIFDAKESGATESEEAKGTDYTAVIILAIVAPVFFYFRHLGREDAGFNAAVCLGMCLVAVRIRWDLRNRLWFWGVVAFVLALQVPLIFVIQWPHVWIPGLALLPVGLADVAITLGAVRLVEKVILKSPAIDEEQ